MSRRLTALVVVALLAIAGCSSPKKEVEQPVNNPLPTPVFEAGTTMNRIQNAGKIKVGVKFDQPGFGQKNAMTQKIEGFDVEIAKLLVLGIFGGTKADIENKIEFVETVSKNREPYLQDGTVDMVVATYSITEARKKQVDFAGPYHVAHGDIMVKSANKSIFSVTDLNGKSVCTTKGSTYPATLSVKAPEAVVTTLDTYAQCVEALKQDKVVALTTDNNILGGLVETSNGEYKLVNAPFTDEPYGIGVKRMEDVFRSFLNDRLDAIEKDGSWLAAYNLTLGSLGLPAVQPPVIDKYAPTGPTTTVAPVTTTTTPVVNPPTSVVTTTTVAT